MAAHTARSVGNETLKYLSLNLNYQKHHWKSRCILDGRRHALRKDYRLFTTGCTTATKDQLSELSTKGLTHVNQVRPNDDDYIGQPTHVTHPHLVGLDEVTPGISKKEYIDRRYNLMRYPFRQNTDFLYLTGFQEPDSVLILETHAGNPPPDHKSILFVRPRDPRRELWEGSRAGVQGAIGVFGMDEAYPIKELTSKMIERYSDNDYCIWYDHLNPSHPLLHAELRHVLFGNPKFKFKKAMTKVISMTRPGLEESHLHIAMEYECRMKGAERLSYPPVVAGGSLANTLHYINNTQLLRDGDLVLMDAGCEYHGYASDITRTWPVNGTFTEPQRQLYDIVLRIQKKCLSASTEFCPHHVGHYLGMDTHDTSLVSRGLGLQPGMIVTIEPGLYIPNNARHVPERYRGIGIRIEDDVLITDGSPEILSDGCPKEPEELEKLLKNSQV